MDQIRFPEIVSANSIALERLSGAAWSSRAGTFMATAAGLAVVGLSWEALKGVAARLIGTNMVRDDLLSGMALILLLVCFFYFGWQGWGRFQNRRLSLAERRQLAEVEAGLSRGEFVAYFQPIYDMRAGRIVAAEALVRWIDRDGKLRAPDEFIPLLEKAGRLHSITQRMISGAAQALHFCSLAGVEIDISVNVSAHDLENVDLVGEIEQACRQVGVEPRRLKVELTETHSLQRIDLASKVCDALVARGIRVVLDDFGTGYASLHMLDLLPFSQIKLDRFFVSRLAEDPIALAIVKTSLSLAACMNADIVAEGVEDAATAARLSQMGIRLVQGYHFGKPMPLRQFLHTVSSQRFALVG
jgi:EAL domain-containing protein (putative c-di-GMP-specific phosphodiesterase class I)